MSRIKNLEKAIREHDKLLFCRVGSFGEIQVWRKSQFDCNPPHFVLALTHNWRASGTPREYGFDIVIARLKANDLWRDDKFVENYLKEHDREVESKEQDRRNTTEAFLYDFHSEFKKTHSQINTSSMQSHERKVF